MTVPDEDTVERVAKAIRGADCFTSDHPMAPSAEAYRRMARAALVAVPPPSRPDYTEDVAQICWALRTAAGSAASGGRWSIADHDALADRLENGQ